MLLRHAKSSWKDDLPDVERPLSPRGRRDAAVAGRWLAEHVGRPDLVLCSVAVRTRQTWAVGYDYPLSKRTDVYAAYMNDHISGLSNGNTFGAGIRAKF